MYDIIIMDYGDRNLLSVGVEVTKGSEAHVILR